MNRWLLAAFGLFLAVPAASIAFVDVSTPSLPARTYEPAAPAPAGPPAAPVGVVANPRMVGLDYLLDLPRHAGDADYILAAAAAQFEQQGVAPGGIADALAQGTGGGTMADRGSVDGPPGATYSDMRLFCDVNEDKVIDLVSSDYFVGAPHIADYEGWPVGSSSVFTINGKTGERMRGADNHAFLTIGSLTRGGYPYRAAILPPFFTGQPMPHGSENFGAGMDLNGDEVCDAIAMGLDVEWCLPVACLVNVYIQALDGKTMDQIWERTFQSTFVFAGWDPPQVAEVVVLDFPSGFLAFDTPDGPRYAFKTTDLYFTFFRDDVLTGQCLYDYRVYESVHYADATNPNVDEQDLWVRELSYDNGTSTTNFTWIGGVADLDGGTQPEVVLDQFYVTNPRDEGCGLLGDDPVTQKPLLEYGKGMSVLAFHGEAPGDDAWRTIVHHETPARVNTQGEEQFQTLVWTYSQVLPDLTGDGIPDVVATWLAQEQNEKTSVNGRFRTHILPLSGANGSKLWRADHEFTGWGYAASMSATNETLPYFAFGFVDLPSRTPPAGRFPEKNVRIEVLDAQDGSVKDSWEGQFSQDSYVPYHMALFQYRTTLAPHDWDRDGVLDVVTPSQYIRPSATNQTLLSTATHKYEILSGADLKKVLFDVTAWGSNGMVVACPGAEQHLTVVSGHARRVDVTRLNLSTGKSVPEWRRAVYFDPAITAAVRGADFIGLSADCADAPGLDNRTFFNANLVRNAPSRGPEISNLYGFVWGNGSMHWQRPRLDPDPGIASFLDLLPKPEAQATAGQSFVVNLGPALLGLAAGAGMGILKNLPRRKGGASK